MKLKTKSTKVIDFNVADCADKKYINNLFENCLIILDKYGRSCKNKSLEAFSDERLFGGNVGTRSYHRISILKEYVGESGLEIKCALADDPGYEDGMVDPSITKYIQIVYQKNEVFLAKKDLSVTTTSPYFDVSPYKKLIDPNEEPDNAHLTLFVLLGRHGSWTSEIDKLAKKKS